jgi:hypothetical protein
MYVSRHNSYIFAFCQFRTVYTPWIVFIFSIRYNQLMKDSHMDTTQHETYTATRKSGRPVRNRWIALAISLFVGHFGVDRFYLGKIGTGILKLISLGGFWYLVDY